MTTFQKTYGRGVIPVLLIILLVGAFLRLHQLDSLPPGLFFDEAINALDAQDTWRNGHYPIFYPANYGREPFYIYLQALIMKLAGEKVFNLRLVSAYAGLLTIPFVFTLGKTLFRKVTQQAVWIGITAAAALSTSYWHVSMSRLGFRTILLPIFVMLTLLGFWWGYEREQKRWYILAGIALGVSQYTYLSARALPLVVAAIISLCLLFLVFKRKFAKNEAKTLLIGSVLMGLTAFLVYIPLGMTQLGDAATASTRVDDVSLIAQAIEDEVPIVQAVLQNFILVSRMFVDQGDTMLRHNLPRRPALDLFNVIGFFTGLVLLLRFWKRPQSWLLICWLIIMLLPTLLATQAPHYLRASGAIGAVAIIVGVGLVWWWQKAIVWLGKMEWAKRPFALQLLLPILVLVIGTWSTTKDYFVRWPQSYYLYDTFDGADYEAAVFAQEKLKEGALYLIPPADWPARPTPVLQFMLNFTDVQPLAYQCHVFQPQSTTPVIYLIRTFHDEKSLLQVQEFLPGGQVEQVAIHPQSGEVWYQAYTVYPEETMSAAPATAVAQFGDAIQLTYTDTKMVDNAIHITSTWQASQQPSEDHTLFIHLYREGEENAEPVAQLDVQPCYPTGKWRDGEALRETYTLTLPPDLGAGNYTLAFGWYTWPSFERLPITASDNTLPNHRLQLGQITIDD